MPYFYNLQTGKTQWERPTNGIIQQGKPLQEYQATDYAQGTTAITQGGDYMNQGGFQKQKAPAGATIKVSHLPIDWSNYLVVKKRSA